VASRLAELGAGVALIYSGNHDAAEAARLECAAFGAKAQAYVCRAEDFEAVKAVCSEIAREFGGVDILVNNAGRTRDNLLLRMGEEDFDEVLVVNLKGAFNFTRHLARHLLKSPAGRIINVSSVSGLTGNPGQANYSASKAGLIGLTKTVARELAGRGVTCNAIAPGFIDTDMTAAVPAAARENLLAQVPLRRAGTAAEVAGLIAFLAGDAAGYITGEVIRIDGGMGM
jgi:3-oxoacyl-[acyl-carrier protein] reductase